MIAAQMRRARHIIGSGDADGRVSQRDFARSR